MVRAIEDAVKVDRVELPAGSDGRDIFVQAGNQRNMPWAGFGRDSSMRHAKSAVIEDFGSEERSKRSWLLVCLGLGVRFWK